MDIELEMNNRIDSPLEKSFFEKVAKRTFSETGFNLAGGSKFSLSLAIVGKEEMRRINKAYRRKDSSTDVLSFSEFENIRDIDKARESNKDMFLGEVIMCYNDIKGYCRDNDLPLREELARVFSHAVLHLLGFEHGKKMFDIQNRIAGSVGDIKNDI